MNNNIKYILIFLVLFVICGFIYWLSIDKKFSLENKYYNNKGLVSVSSDNVDELVNSKKSFILFTYNNYCNFSIPCDEVFESVSKSSNVEILKINFMDFKNTLLYKNVKYAPTVIIVNKCRIIDYLDANADEDIDLYQNEDKFKKWLSSYVNI